MFGAFFFLQEARIVSGQFTDLLLPVASADALTMTAASVVGGGDGLPSTALLRYVHTHTHTQTIPSQIRTHTNHYDRRRWPSTALLR